MKRNKCHALVVIGYIIPSLFLTQIAIGHESRPAYLQLTEIKPNFFQWIWNVPSATVKPAPIELQFHQPFGAALQLSRQTFASYQLSKGQVSLNTGVDRPAKISFLGLQATQRDVIVRVSWLNGLSSVQVIKAQSARFLFEKPADKWRVVLQYVLMGTEHILHGYDHLLFIVMLLLLSCNRAQLFILISYFTVAHSITLVLLTLNWLSVAAAPIEAVISLSIMFLAKEVISVNQGSISLTGKKLAVMVLCFGLLHGMGFAAAINDIGLPVDDKLWAVLAFNIGVEVGQIGFILALIGGGVLVKTLAARCCVVVSEPAQKKCLSTQAYLVGGGAAFWFVERLLS